MKLLEIVPKIRCLTTSGFIFSTWTVFFIIASLPNSNTLLVSNAMKCGGTFARVCLNYETNISEAFV